MPDVPPLADFVPGYEASAWYGVGAPKGTPAEIVDKLNQEINAALADPPCKARLIDLGGTVLPGSPADLAGVHRGGDREVGQGGAVRRHQAGVTLTSPIPASPGPSPPASAGTSARP